MKLDFLTGGNNDGGGAGRGRFDFMIPRHDPVPRPLDDARRVIRVGLMVAGAFFGLFMLFALLAPISGAAVAVGEVTTSGSRVTIQPASGGVVSEFLVSEGQRVRAGQPLVRLNGVRSTAAAQQAQAKRDALRALQARLIAERDGLDMLVFPPDLTQRSGDPAAASAIAAQSAIFVRNRDVLSADRAIAGTERDSAQAQRTGARRQLALINDELRSIRSLYAKGYARITQVRSLERAAAQLQAESTAGASAVARADLQSARLASTQVMQIVSQLGQVDEQLAQIDPALRVTRYDADRALMRAPVDGRASGVARIGTGTVLSAGQTIMEIVPQGRALIVETRIKPEDADDVRLGSPATLRFTTINPRGQSSFTGKVVAFSPSRVTGAPGEEGYFRAQIAIDDPAALARGGVEITPGLPVAVHVETRSRTLFDFLFAPLADAFSGGFREE